MIPPTPRVNNQIWDRRKSCVYGKSCTYYCTSCSHYKPIIILENKGEQKMKVYKVIDKNVKKCSECPYCLHELMQGELNHYMCTLQRVSPNDWCGTPIVKSVNGNEIDSKCPIKPISQFTEHEIPNTKQVKEEGIKEYIELLHSSIYQIKKKNSDILDNVPAMPIEKAIEIAYEVWKKQD